MHIGTKHMKVLAICIMYAVCVFFWMNTNVAELLSRPPRPPCKEEEKETRSVALIQFTHSFICCYMGYCQNSPIPSLIYNVEGLVAWTLDFLVVKPDFPPLHFFFKNFLQ